MDHFGFWNWAASAMVFSLIVRGHAIRFPLFFAVQALQLAEAVTLWRYPDLMLWHWFWVSNMLLAAIAVYGALCEDSPFFVPGYILILHILMKLWHYPSSIAWLRFEMDGLYHWIKYVNRSFICTTIFCAWFPGLFEKTFCTIRSVVRRREEKSHGEGLQEASAG